MPENGPVPRKPWELQDGEPTKWYSIFQKLCLMAPESRSMLAVYVQGLEREGKIKAKRPTAPPPSWGRAAVKWRWQERCRAWDEHQLAEVQREWERRQKEWREKEWVLAQRFVEKLEQMLSFPVAEIKRDKDGTTIKPGKWTFRTAATFGAIASKLARLASGLETEITEHRGEQISRDDVEKVRGEIERILKGEEVTADTDAD